MSSSIILSNDSLFFADLTYTSYTVLTDNKTYRLQIDENNTGTRDFRIATVSDKFPDDEMEKILNVLLKYGFSSEDIFRVKSSCSSDPYLKKQLGGKLKGSS